jgi:hypothetical protein
MMNKSILFVILAVEGLMTSAIAQNPMTVQAAIPEDSKLSLPLDVVLYTNGKKVKDVTAWIEYKEHIKKYEINMKGKSEQEIIPYFPPEDRGIFDFYKVCVRES